MGLMSLKKWTLKEVDEILRANGLQSYIDEVDAAKYRKRKSKKVFRSVSGEEEKKEVVQSPGEIIGNIVFEQQNQTNYIVYDIELDDFLITDREKGFTSWETEKTVYVPISRPLWRNLPIPEMSPFLLRDLYADVRRFIFNHVDFAKDTEYDLATAWVLHTWRLENFSITPYLFFYGPASSGKTRAMEALAALSFRPFMGATKPAGLYNLTERYKPTIFLDETELYLRGEEKADVINYLNMGYRRGQQVIRMIEDKKTGKLEATPFDTFGAKSLAGTRDLMTTLKTRSFIYFMSRATRKLRRTIDWEEADRIKRTLITYRFKALAETRERNTLLRPIPDDFLPDLQDSRLRELFFPLVSCSPDPSLFLKYAYVLDEEITRQDELSIESFVFNAIVQCHTEGRQFIPLTEVVNFLNLTLPSDDTLSSKTVSAVLRRLGFKKFLKRYIHIVWDDQLVERLSKRYPIRKTEV